MAAISIKSTRPDIYKTLTSAYEAALGRSYSKTEGLGLNFAEAEAPLQENVGLFRPGGGYGAGQNALIEQEARKGYASGLSNLVGTGMSSGTNTAGLRARITADTTRAKLGVEDERVGRLSQALALLSQLRSTKAQTIASSAPNVGAYMGALTSAYSTDVGAQSAFWQSALGYKSNLANIASREKIAGQQLEANKATQHFNTPW